MYCGQTVSLQNLQGLRVRDGDGEGKLGRVRFGCRPGGRRWGFVPEIGAREAIYLNSEAVLLCW